MKTTLLLLATFAAAPGLQGQDDKKAPPAAGMQMQDPKTPEHAAIAPFAGTWTCTMKSEAMPGVPGMEKAAETTGTETSELVCNGLWLKSAVKGTAPDGKPFEGLWLLGYDPHSKSYTGIWASNQEEPSSVMKGSFDSAKKTWSFTGQCPMGPFRSSLVWNDADTTTETCYAMAGDGKETKFMEIVRKRGKPGGFTDATAGLAKPASKELALLAEGVGTWDAVVKNTVPGAPPTEDKGKETIVAICDGKWYWSDYKGTMMGTPFEGHAITGYDPTTKKFVMYWIDSMSPVFTRTEGEYDATKKAFVMNGKCVGMDGQEMTVSQTATQTPDARVLKMLMKSPSASHEMQIDYKRAK